MAMSLAIIAIIASIVGAIIVHRYPYRCHLCHGLAEADSLETSSGHICHQCYESYW